MYGGKEPMLRRVALNTAPGRVFPDVLSVWMTTSDLTVNMTAAPAYSETYKLNSVGTGVGPQTNYTGAFAGNFPSALRYLLSTNTSPSSAPYYQARIVESRIRVDVIPDVYVAAVSTAPFTVGILPTANATLSGLSTTNINEQPLAKYSLCGSTSAGKITTLRHAVRTGTLFGHSDSQVRTVDDYNFVVNSDPVRLAYWQLYFRSLDGTSNISGKFVVTIEHHFEFMIRLNLTTTAPVLTSPTVVDDYVAVSDPHNHSSSCKGCCCIKGN